MRTKLTPALSLEPTASKVLNELFWDQTLPGFGLMVTASGHKSYVVQYRAARASRRVTISGVLPLDKARKEAKGVLGAVARGGDPRANSARP